MSRFAEKTTVSSESSRMEIERDLRRYGASGFMYGWNESGAVVAFQMLERHVKFVLPLPDPNDKVFRLTPARGTVRSPKQQEEAYEQAVRQRWRALALVIKAKLEAVSSGITCFEDEFMAHIVMPDGKTVSQHVKPGIVSAYASGKMPALLPDLTGGNHG